ncbi:exopolyphosphatase [Paraliomyxa miuraensis]|uniref:exopolyphosphatase n=1 Tax=Paraliomyxa miuraensis TaxID=376150 RepID=UPI002257062D|nr:exopolyphosphatase [Paraliomyxa miuraensis]MCX4245270.1 exopolyphosphatase [Paraliomyxa miuraensis]
MDPKPASEATEAIDDETPSELVAIDLGSNSFHMVIARVVGGQLDVVDRMRERVKLAAGLDANKHLTEEAQRRALECLERFAQRLRPLPHARVRAVGTNTLRRARNAREFLGRARTALGHPIEVISGREEARIVYLGVAHDLSDDAGRRLVIDIGGGSTEAILGERFEARRTESLHMGCVSHTAAFFGDGRLRRDGFREAITEAQVELEPIKRDFRRLGWVSAVGSSGTILAIDSILRTNSWGWSEGITYAGLKALREAMIEQGRLDRLTIAGLTEERASVLPGGLAILMAAFKSLRIDRMTAATGALREGLLYDTLGRIQHEDVRDRTIERLSERYGIDRDQALRVQQTARACLTQVAHAWSLHHPEYGMLLDWAARLHEIGLIVSFSGFHTHGAYLLTHSDMPGFSRDQQAYLAALVAAHRRRPKPERVEALRAAGGEVALRLAALLRLAATLNRARDPTQLPPLQLTAAGPVLELRLPGGWLDGHPMTAADLRQQQQYLAMAGFHLTVS